MFSVDGSKMCDFPYKSKYLMTLFQLFGTEPPFRANLLRRTCFSGSTVVPEEAASEKFQGTEQKGKKGKKNMEEAPAAAGYTATSAPAAPQVHAEAQPAAPKVKEPKVNGEAKAKAVAAKNKFALLMGDNDTESDEDE